MLESSFAAESRRLLVETYLPRIRAAWELLPPSERWWCPHPEVLSFGVILRHLEGNVRQWVLSGLGGAEDHRRRREEFEGGPGEEEDLLPRLEETVRAAGEVILACAPRLDEAITIQGMETSVMAAIYHVVEHFSWHLGQATWIAKARAGVGHGFALYDEDAINDARND